MSQAAHVLFAYKIHTHFGVKMMSSWLLLRFSVGECGVSETLSAATYLLKNLMAASQEHRRNTAQYLVAQGTLSL